MCVGYAPVVLIMPLFCVAWWSCKKPTSQHKRASSLKRWKTFFYLRWEIFWDLNQKSAPNPSTILIPTYVQPHRKTGGPAGTTSFPLAKFKLEVESNCASEFSMWPIHFFIRQASNREKEGQNFCATVSFAEDFAGFCVNFLLVMWCYL